MAESKARWSICPVAECYYALEYDPEDLVFCPTCELELVSECPACAAPIETDEQAICNECGAGLVA